MESNEVHLLPHNEEAFIKLKKCLEDNQLVAINHATGTGKSFIILKYLCENKDKRILFLSPSYPINTQLIQEHTKDLGIDINEFNKIDTLIYRSLLEKDMEEIANNYDIIVLDEYHRCGAKKWGIKINELLACVKEKHKETKIIGTTATEIRYLDNEKNMNNILFDGVCASTLTLADAMLKEILPVPIYINSLVDLSIEYEKIVKKIYKKSLYDRERDYYLQLVKDIREQIDEIINNENSVSSYIKKDGKHLVFSSTIDNIIKDKFLIKKLFNCNYNEYEVHSRNTTEYNEKTLKNFRETNDPAVLYCVNILNEGVHVKGVDSIFMLRPTTSPIIFFQQLGRLLSYSRRRDNVIVFDLVNNIRQNPHIYKLYIDLYERTNELIKIDPENKDRYLNIVKKFKVVDATSEIYDKLDTLKNALSKENFYKKRIDFVIEILQEKNMSNETDKKLAQTDLFKYYKYVTLEQCRIIRELDINKPPIFYLSEEEFVDILSGEKNIYQKEKKLIKVIIDKVNRFYEMNGHFPSILAQSKEESLLAQYLMRIYDGDKVDRTIFKNKNIDNLTEHEKIVYGITRDINLNLLYGEIDEFIANNMDTYQSILDFLQAQKTEIAKRYFSIVLKYITNKSKKEKDNGENNSESSIEKKSKDELTNLKIMYTENYARIAKECILEIQNYSSVEEYLRKFSEEFVKYVKESRRMPVYYMAGLNDQELEKMRVLYIKKMIFYHELKKLGYINLFDEMYNSVQMELTRLKKTHVLEKLMEFLKEHNGDMPSLKLETDRTLALEFSRIKSILDENDITLINSYKRDNRTSEVAMEYIDFVKKHKRYPSTTTTDEEEKALLNDYIRNELYFNENDKKMISNLEKTRVLEKLLEFLKEHNGDMPSLKLETDKTLALEFSRIKSSLDENDINLINSYKRDNRTREVVIKYITFVKKYKRYPLTTATDEEEKALLNDYIRNELYFNENDKKMINSLNKIVSSRQAMQNAYAELLKQKKRR